MLALVNQFSDIRASEKQHLQKSSSVLILEQTRTLCLFAVVLARDLLMILFASFVLSVSGNLPFRGCVHCQSLSLRPGVS